MTTSNNDTNRSAPTERLAGRTGVLEERSQTNSAPPPENSQQEDVVRPGETNKLVIPRETIDEDPELAGEEIESTIQIVKTFRRPHRRDWIQIDPKSEYQTLLIEHTPKDDSPEREYFWVARPLRRNVEGELKQVRVFLTWSLRNRNFAPWVVKATVGNSWYESIAKLLKRPDAEFEQFEYRIVGNQASNKYCIRRRSISHRVEWPEVDMGTLLAEVVGEANFITDDSHPFYCELVSGEEL